MATPVQPSYIDNPSAGYAGFVPNGELSNRISRTVDAAIGYGCPAFRTGEHTVAATGTPAAFLGVTIANLAALPSSTGVQADTYPAKTTAAILTQGVIWVSVPGAATAGEKAYGTAGGAVTAASSGNTELTGWLFQDTIAAAGLVRIAKR